MAASREAFLTAIAIYDQLIVRSPENANYRFARAELQANAADLSVQLRRLPESRALGAAARSALLAAARQSDADPVQLTIAARHLLECRLPQCRGYPLALTFMKRANAKGGDDAEIQEVTAEAYWRTGDRQQAVAAIQRALSLIEPQPTPDRKAPLIVLNSSRPCPHRSNASRTTAPCRSDRCHA